MESSVELDAEDFQPQAPGSDVPKWKRNVPKTSCSTADSPARSTGIASARYRPHDGTTKRTGMRSADINIGDLYAVEHDIEGERAPSHFSETFPQWKAEAREHLGVGRWAVHLLELDRDVEVSSAAIQEPWDHYAERMQRRQAARKNVLSERLTWEEFENGEPCPGCGRPYVDDAPRVLTFTNAVKAVERLLKEGSVPPAELDSRVYARLVGHGLVEHDGDTLIPTARAREALRLRREDEQWRENHECPDDIPRRGWATYGGGSTHCGGCCPPAPLSPETLDKVARILTTMAHRPPSDTTR
ncbi:MAG: hypothetical protein M3252_03345 [Actinomycetota bacterium]|nr:hypothetical protein [Actinomycetota bacterium]